MREHYRKVSVEDNLSSEIFESYLSEIDPTRSYFLASDINEFEPYRCRLDDLLVVGDLEPAFIIFNRYIQRANERLQFRLGRLDRELNDISFDVNESMNSDREEAPWPADIAELNEISRKTFKNSILNLKLAGKTLDEITEVLEKRYQNQLARLRQTRSEDVFELYMNALARQFDPHTSYFSPRAAENFDISMSQSLEGIGVLLRTENEYTVVVQLVPGGPAEKSKQLKVSDRIVGVGQGPDGEMVNIVGWRIDDLVELIRGPKNTMVRLEIIPNDAVDDQTKMISLERSAVQLEEQTAKMELIDIEHQGRSSQIAVIELPTFYLDFNALNSGDRNYRSSTRDVKRLLRELSQTNVEGLVIDLRNNSGGLLQEAIELTGLFIERGPIVQVREANGKMSILRDPDYGIYYRGPLAVLTNRLSASASEICAAAIQDYGRGMIIGQPTFGKGTVQSLLKLNHGELKATIAKFYRISGESTQYRGTRPDFTYPDLHDKEEIGESALPNALPWDTISGTAYEPFNDLSPLLGALRERHERRLQDDPDVKYLLALRKHLDEVRSETVISLNETVRRRERDETRQRRLDLENRRRRDKHQEPITELSELESDAASDDAHDNEDEQSQEDPMLIEAARILLDYVELSASKITRP
ncbi:MAG: carboxy terminal-processing peptidase [Sedimentisphaerales bacterium]|nr:carboxy terminal-processing peptidase [Sedimentisphaerales bacterium]